MGRKESGLSLVEGAGCQLFHTVCVTPGTPVLAGRGAVLTEPALVHGPAEWDGNTQGWQDWVLVVQSGALIPFILGVCVCGGGLPGRGNCELTAEDGREFQEQRTDCEGARPGTATRSGSWDPSTGAGVG